MPARESLSWVSLLIALTIVRTGPAQEADPASAGDPVSPATTEAATEDPAHDELRRLRDGLTSAINEMRIDDLLSYLHQDVVVTWLDGTSSRGRDEVRSYLEDKLSGANKIVEKFTIEPQVSELTILYGGDTGISYGTGKSRFQFVSRGDMTFDGPWSATLVKDSDDWLIASFHASAGIFKNPLLAVVRRMLWWVGGLSAVVGAVVGWFLGKRSKRSVSQTPTAD